jgi:hypothetical protein
LSDSLYRLARWSILVIAMAVLSACANDEEDPGVPCPAAKVLAQPSELIRYREGAGRDPTDVRFEARMMRVFGECSYDSDGGEIDVELDVTMDILRGPALADGAVSYRYFVAVAEWVSQDATEPVILSRESLPVETVIPAGRRGLSYKDLLEITIPRPDNRDVRNYVIYIGFELTRDELKHNRERFGY